MYLAQKAEALRSLHQIGKPLVLPNAWDVASARIFAEAGFPAIATTSGGVAEVLGYPDGEMIPLGDMFDAVARIARAVDVPVTADLEAGYGLDPDDLVSMLLDAGAVGLNHEDTVHAAGKRLRDIDEQTARLAGIKEAGNRHGVDIVLNARVDVYIRATHDAQPEELLELALERATAYRDAGADCIFPIFCDEDAAIETLVRETKSPVNVLARSGISGISRLANLGVARITFGSGLMRLASEVTRRHADALRARRLPWE